MATVLLVHRSARRPALVLRARPIRRRVVNMPATWKWSAEGWRDGEGKSVTTRAGQARSRRLSGRAATEGKPPGISPNVRGQDWSRGFRTQLSARQDATAARRRAATAI